MAIYELTDNEIRPMQATTFAAAKIRERDDLQRLLREHVEVVCPDTLVIAEEFSEWDDANRRIDLLGLDKEGNLVVIELKRTESGGHMDLQALCYAAMVSAMTFERAVDLYRKFLAKQGIEEDAEARLRKFLELEDTDAEVDEQFAQDVRVVLASAEFSKELTTTVLWLNEHGLDVRCVRLRPYTDGQRVLLDVQQVIPLPEAEQYQVQLREKAQRERASRRSTRDYSKFDIYIDEDILTRRNKAQTAYQIVRGLFEKGIKPDQIVEAVSFRKTNAFFCLQGEYRREHDFVFEASKVREAVGSKFDEWRFFTGSEELFIVDGKTYALSKQWGGRAEEWMNEVLAAFPGKGIRIKKCDPS